jgi:hypothetical protein
VWRTSGNFVIDSTNNKLDFNDGGAEISVTLTNGTYTPSQLGSHIQTQLNASAGIANYTVTYSSLLGYWTIQSDGATFNILWDSGTNTATSVAETLGFDPDLDSTGGLAYQGYLPAIHTEEWALLDLSTAESIDSFALVFDKTDGSKLSSSAVVKIQANATDSWSSPAVNVTVAFDEDFETYTYRWASSQSYRYWRVLITDPNNAYGYVELGVAVLSLATQLSQVPSIGFQQELVDLSKKAMNDYGNEFFDVYPSRRELVFNHVAMPESDVQTLAEIYERNGKVTPICVWLDPSAVLYDKDRFFIYGRLAGSFKATQNFYTFFDQELSIIEAL